MLGRFSIRVLRNISNKTKNIRNLSIASSSVIQQHNREYGNILFTTNQRLSSTKPTVHIVDSVLDHATYEKVCSDTLDGLNDYFEQLLESVEFLQGSDIQYSDGVLTIKLGNSYGTYVINRQTPNKQIWLSSPTSGPKRYDFVGPPSGQTGKWVYKHDGQSLHALLQHELQIIFKDQKIEFEDLPYGI